MPESSFSTYKHNKRTSYCQWPKHCIYQPHGSSDFRQIFALGLTKTWATCSIKLVHASFRPALWKAFRMDVTFFVHRKYIQLFFFFFCPFASLVFVFGFCVFSVVFVVTLKIHDRTPSWHSFYDCFFGGYTFSFAIRFFRFDINSLCRVKCDYQSTWNAGLFLSFRSLCAPLSLKMLRW